MVRMYPCRFPSTAAVWVLKSLTACHSNPSLLKKRAMARKSLECNYRDRGHQLNNYLWIIFSFAAQNNLFLLIVLMFPHLLIQEWLLWHLYKSVSFINDGFYYASPTDPYLSFISDTKDKIGTEAELIW